MNVSICPCKIHSKAKPQELIVSLQRYWENCESTSIENEV